MNPEELRSLQAPLKQKYRENETAALVAYPLSLHY